MQNYLDKINERQIKLARLSTGILKDDVYPSIDSVYQRISLIINQFGDIKSIRDVNRLNTAIKRAVNEGMTEGFAAATNSMANIAVSEAVFGAALLSSANSVLSSPSSTRVNKYVREAIMSLTSGKTNQSAVWADFVTGYKGSMSDKYNAIIVSAYNISLSTGKMPSRRELNNRFRALSNNLLKSNAEALVRTGVSHYAAKANQLMALDNSDVIEKEVPIVTFDSRVSDTCISIDARYSDGWIVGKSPIGYPPYHYQCRTVIGHLLYGQEAFEGLKQADGDSKIKADTPLAKWLRNKPKAYIQETLGKRKGQLFLDGKLPLANLTDKYLKSLPISALDV